MIFRYVDLAPSQGIATITGMFNDTNQSGIFVAATLRRVTVHDPNGDGKLSDGFLARTDGNGYYELLT